MFIRYKGPEPRISFQPADGFSEQGLPPFLDRMTPIEVRDELGKRVLHTHVEVPQPDGTVKHHSRRNADWEECDDPNAPKPDDQVRSTLAPREFVINEQAAERGRKKE